MPQIAARLDERNHGEKECYGVFREEGSIACWWPGYKNRVLTEFFIITLMDRAERPDHKYIIPTCELPIVLELSTLDVRPVRNGKSRDSRFVTSHRLTISRHGCDA